MESIAQQKNNSEILIRSLSRLSISYLIKSIPDFLNLKFLGFNASIFHMLGHTSGSIRIIVDEEILFLPAHGTARSRKLLGKICLFYEIIVNNNAILTQ